MHLLLPEQLFLLSRLLFVENGLISADGEPRNGDQGLEMALGEQDADSQISTSHDRIKFLLIFYVDLR